MKYIMKYIAVLILIFYLPTNAQETISIEKSEVITRIKNRNLSLKISAEEFNKEKQISGKQLLFSYQTSQQVTQEFQLQIL